ncbi:DUF3995 domain-containing protein [Marinoscillum sp.]|uniref:DUF3995 domain-containing protein n=1 Tax=Marinoscillum sp. TaxID=2024838 RepID=UPI003BAAD603
MLFPTILLSGIFLVLSGIHWYWLFGGEWGFEAALPCNKEGKRVLNPKKVDTMIVATALLYFAVFYSIQIEIVNLTLPYWLMIGSQWSIPSIFLLRAIGDFKYVGAFKRIKGTLFAEKDSKFFTPLCFLIGILGFYLLINQ